MANKQFNTDCEGPVSLNDNAYELANNFIPDGGRFFAQMSKYDDILADIVNKPGYAAGNTLKLIVPFLKAYDITNEMVKRYSAENIVFIQGAELLLKYLSNRMPTFIISTSYEPYINAICNVIGFDKGHTYSTELDLDKYDVDVCEVDRLREVREEVSTWPLIEFNDSVKVFNELPIYVQEIVDKLDEFFWEELQSMRSRRLLEDVHPIGGPGKVDALLHSLKITGNNIQDVIYVGDSITDSDVLKLVKQEGGLAIAFNGNKYAIREADVACVSYNAIVILIIGHVFLKEGKAGVIDLILRWSPETLNEYDIDDKLVSACFNMYDDNITMVKMVEESNRLDLITKSELFRKVIRTKEIGSLG